MRASVNCEVMREYVDEQPNEQNRKAQTIEEAVLENLRNEGSEN